MVRWREFRACLREVAEPPRLWWRDDDAVSDCESLRAYLEGMRGLPILLAVIADLYAPSLIERVRDNSQISIAQHGFRHVDHACEGDGKKSEYPRGRDPQGVRQELRAGNRKMQVDFATQYSGVFVPPWNRMSDTLMPLLEAEGFSGVSMWGQMRQPHASLLRYDTHVDVINWRAEKSFWGGEEVLSALIKVIKESSHSTHPIGILTHHRVHSRDCQSFLLDFTAFLQDNSDIIITIPPPFCGPR